MVEIVGWSFLLALTLVRCLEKNLGIMFCRFFWGQSLKCQHNFYGITLLNDLWFESNQRLFHDSLIFSFWDSTTEFFLMVLTIQGVCRIFRSRYQSIFVSHHQPWSVVCCLLHTPFLCLSDSAWLCDCFESFVLFQLLFKSSIGFDASLCISWKLFGLCFGLWLYYCLFVSFHGIWLGCQGVST